MKEWFIKLISPKSLLPADGWLVIPNIEAIEANLSEEEAIAIISERNYSIKYYSKVRQIYVC